MRRALYFTLFLLWTLFLLGGYFVYHKPGLVDFNAVPAPHFPGWLAFGTHWLSLARDAAAAVGIVLACLGFGRVLLGRFHLDGLDGLALQAALGGGVFSLAWLGLAAAGLINSWSAWGLWFLAIILLNKEIRAGLAQLETLQDYWTFSGKFERTFLVIAAVLAVNQLWVALSPAVKYDALTYHLAIPRQMSTAGGLVFSPTNPYWGHPQVAEMLFTWAMALGKTDAAALTAWLFGVVAIIGTAGLSARWLPNESDAAHISSAVSMALIALFAAGSVRWMGSWAYTDLFSALMGLGGLSCLFAWRDSGRPGWLYWMGVFIGLAVGTKFTAGVLALLLFPAALISPGVNHKPLRSILLSGLISLVVFAPWAIKNLVYTQSPLFPYVIPTADYSQARLDAANLPPEQVNWLAAATLPVSATWTGIDGAAGPGTDLGPLLVLFALPGLVVFHRSSRTRIITAGLMIVWIIIAIGGARFDHLQQPRLYFVLLPALGCVTGWGWSAVQQLQTGGLRMRRISGVLVLFALGLLLAIDLPRPLTNGAVQTALGLREREAYLYDNTGAYMEAMNALSALPSDAGILMLWEGRNLYAPLNAHPDPWLDRWRTDLHEMGSTDQVLAAWRSNGYTHILMHVDGMHWMRASDRNLSTQDWQAFDRFFFNLPAPVRLTGDHYRLYTLP